MICTLCGRSGDNPQLFEEHHLFPGKHRRIKVDRKTDTIIVCTACGDAIHQQLTDYQLRTEFDSIDSLKVALNSFITWVRKQPLETHICMKKKKKRM